MWKSNRGALITIILLGILALVLSQTVKQTDTPQVQLDDHQEQVVTDTEAAVVPTGFSPIPPQQGERISYGAALRAFIGSTIAFDTACRARPTTMSVQARSQVLLDNQSAQERTISVGSRIYVIPRYDFAIVTMQRSGTSSVACDDFENAAIIGVE